MYAYEFNNFKTMKLKLNWNLTTNETQKFIYIDATK